MSSPSPLSTDASPVEGHAPLSSVEGRLVLFGGRGGVGKTVFAAALADAWARVDPQHPVSLLSIDPAHSLADAFAGERAPPNLTVDEIDAGLALRAFKGAHDATLAEIARRGTFLDEEDIADLLDLSTPGLDELLALLRIPELLAQDPKLRIILDTAPYGHTTQRSRSSRSRPMKSASTSSCDAAAPRTERREDRASERPRRAFQRRGCHGRRDGGRSGRRLASPARLVDLIAGEVAGFDAEEAPRPAPRRRQTRRRAAAVDDLRLRHCTRTP